MQLFNPKWNERVEKDMNKGIFEDYGVGEEILKSVRKLGFEAPTEVQDKVIPLVLQGRDVVVKSQTGSGKTAAFGIPVIEKIMLEGKNPQALVLTPTRELCVQVKEDLNTIGRFKRIRCAAIFGKQPVSLQESELRQRVNIVVGTPGRVKDLADRGSLVLEDVYYLVIDEADKMLNMGFIDQVESIIEMLQEKRVTMLFSATMPQEIQNLCAKYMIDPVKIEISPQNIISGNIDQIWYEVSDKEKFDQLMRIMYAENPDSAVLFCRTKENVENLYKEMKSLGLSCRALHGGMLQDERLEVMERFKRGEFRFLVATDVASRGIDVEDVTHIINYDVPVENESYVHRIGRTGRAGKRGRAITLVCRNELNIFLGIQEYIGIFISKGVVPDHEEAYKKRADFFEKKGKSLVPKTNKRTMLEEDIAKIYINAGKKKKVRNGDIVGAISSIEGVDGRDIGIIDIRDNYSYIDILNGKGELVIRGLESTSIKGKTVRVQKAEK